MDSSDVSRGGGLVKDKKSNLDLLCCVQVQRTCCPKLTGTSIGFMRVHVRRRGEAKALAKARSGLNK
jgi:hypothetical protein